MTQQNKPQQGKQAPGGKAQGADARKTGQQGGQGGQGKSTGGQKK